MEMPSNLLVVSIGLGTVFFGLICLILLCKILGIVCNLKSEKKTEIVQTSAVVNSPAPIANKQEIVAACCAVIAEEIGTEAKNIKVVSFKKV